MTGAHDAMGACAPATPPANPVPQTKEEVFAAALDGLHPVIHLLELRATDLGVAIAPLYLASARGSLRHVMGCLLHQSGGTSRAAGASGELCAGTSLRLRAIVQRDGVGERMHMVGRRLVPAPGADVAPWASAPDLGSDILSSPDTAILCRGPVGAALLCDALARHRWMHRESGRKWSTDLSGAHALVSAATGGAGFPLLDPLTTEGLVDREVADLLKGLGWLRIVSARMPERSAA